MTLTELGWSSSRSTRGSEIEGYGVEGLIGRGGMSFVHLAGHGGLRKVALNNLGVSSIAWRSRTAARNYFPTIAHHSERNRLIAGWFTNQFDGDFLNRSDVELVRLNDDGNGQVQPTAYEAVERARGRPAPGWVLHRRLHRGVRARPDGVGRLQRELPAGAAAVRGSPDPAEGQLPGQGARVAVAWLGRGWGPRWTGAPIHRLSRTAVTRAAA